MMNENKFSPRAEEALRLAQESAEEMGHAGNDVSRQIPYFPFGIQTADCDCRGGKRAENQH